MKKLIANTWNGLGDLLILHWFIILGSISLVFGDYKLAALWFVYAFYEKVCEIIATLKK